MLSALEINELPELKADDVARRNADLQFFAGRIYQFTGLHLRFGYQQDAVSSASVNDGGVWLVLGFGGQDLVLHCSQAWVQAVLHSQGWSVEGLSEEALNLLGQTRLATLLPGGVALQRLSFSPAGLLSNTLEPQGTWVARHATTQEQSAISVRIWAPPSFSIYAFVKTWDAWLLSQEKPRFAGLPWTMPLVCARWTTEAADIQGLAVGDVLLIDA
jgi:hypothetical protein